jgi:hypothetical protein
MDEQNISIINRSEHTITGEKANALPVRFVANYSWFKIFLAGAILMLALVYIISYFIRYQVVVVDITAKSDQYQEYQMN